MYDGNHNPAIYLSSSLGSSSGWTYKSGTYTVPSNGAYVLLYARIYQPSASTVLRVDDGFLAIGHTATTALDNLDYLPFGEQISGGTSTTHKFAGYGASYSSHDTRGTTVSEMPSAMLSDKCRPAFL